MVVVAIGATFACDDALAQPLQLLLREVRCIHLILLLLMYLYCAYVS